MNKHIPKTKRVFSNYEIIIEIDEPWLIDRKDPERAHSQWTAKLKTVVADIMRHVDGYDQILPRWDTQDVCIYCESDPESDPETGVPACCNKAVEDYDKETDCEPDPDRDAHDPDLPGASEILEREDR